MDVVIVGGHGQIARKLGALLTERGDTARGVIRNPDHAEDLRADGIDPVIVDLEDPDTTGQSLAGAFRGATAAVFAAGSGPGQPAERKWSVDHGGVVKTIDACRHAGVDRIVIVSAIGIDGHIEGDDVYSEYQRAKAQADADVRASGLHYTIVRPALLTDEEGHGRVHAARHVERGPIPRADVAATLLAVLDDPSTVGRTFEVVGGPDDIVAAIAGLNALPDTVDAQTAQG
ncbi:SDR family oxidoreductase [Patulibacter sp. NPDC049589]|uniref:SDR family oxidoreductase n=1 Tax=Patulibacter sp. NPDC049589 TaxID=3154731 RepID=UPI00343654F2